MTQIDFDHVSYPVFKNSVNDMHVSISQAHSDHVDRLLKLLDYDVSLFINCCLHNCTDQVLTYAASCVRYDVHALSVIVKAMHV